MFRLTSLNLTMLRRTGWGQALYSVHSKTQVSILLVIQSGLLLKSIFLSVGRLCNTWKTVSWKVCFSYIIMNLIEGPATLLQTRWSILRWAGKPQPYRSSQCFSWVPVLWCEATICCSNHQSEGRGLSFFYNLSLLNCLITACGPYYHYIVDIFQFRVRKLFANNLELCKSHNTLLELFRQLWTPV